MDKLNNIFSKNKDWVRECTTNNPDFFIETSKSQEPDYLWIGCSDSRVPANQIMDLSPEKVFVHRNIANMVVHTDLNSLSVIHYAIEVLHIKHIIVCGHYGCGGVTAALSNKDYGVIDSWLRHIKDVANNNRDSLRKLNGKDKVDRLCELNAIEQVRNICNNFVVKDAWENGKDLTVHGWMYKMETGELEDLNVNVNSLSTLNEVFPLNIV